MAGIFDFIKKQTPNANPSAAGASSANPTTVVVSSSGTDAPLPTGGSYNGIGAPTHGSSYNGIGAPAHGQSFNGIGTPPGGQSFNGIGAPPSGSSFNGIGTPPPAVQKEVTPEVTVVPAQGAPTAPTVPESETSVSVANQPTVPPPADAQQAAAPPTPEVVPEEVASADIASAPENAEGVNATQTDTSSDAAVISDASAVTPNPQAPADPAAPGVPASEQGQVADPANTPKDGVLSSHITDKKRSDLDVMTHLTQRSNKVFVDAMAKAKELKSAFMDSEHLLHGLLADGEIFKVLTDLKVQPQIVEQELVQVYKKDNATEPPQIAPRVKQIIETSLSIARKLGFEFISPEHILLALYEEGEGVGARVLVKLGVTKEDINKRITGKKAGVIGIGATVAGADKKQQKTKSALEQYAIDLTAKAAAGALDPVVERSPVIERIVHILSRRIKNNPALIGEPGVGKTAVVEGLAQRIVQKQVPESLLNKRILELDLVGVIAGASHRGEFEERMKNIVDELKVSKGEVIMFIDEMHMMMGAGSGDGALDASNFIKPALARGEVQFIGATTITEYRKYIEKDAALERRFQTVVVPEPSEEAAIKMLKAARDKYESFHKVKITDEVIDLAVKLSKRYIGDRFLPDKGFDLMDEAAAAVRLPLISLPEEIKSIENRVGQLNQELSEYERNGDKVKARIVRSKLSDIEVKLKEKKDEYDLKRAQTTTAVTPAIVKDIIAKRTGIPISKIGSQEGDRLAKLEDIIHKRMIDQERAVASVSQAVRRGRAGLKSNSRPIGSFVFLGPSGVGKTELAKTLAEVLFDEEEAVIRFDMTEYMERHEVAKLLGPPPGYVGFEEGGKLTEAVRRKPYSLVLFDEIEKAHPDIFNILLQILDDARLTDNKGRTISFKNTVVICTSNIGTALIQKELLKSGKSEVAEPTVISTYAFTPRGREILTIGNKYFERDGSNPQKNVNLSSQKEADKSQPSQNKPKSQDNGSDPAIKLSAPSSWEDHRLLEYFAGQRLEGVTPALPKEEKEIEGLEKDPQATESKKEGAEDVMPQGSPSKAAFPSFGYDTHAISPKGVEMITTGDLIYVRDATTAKEWKVSNLIDYVAGHVVVNALPDAPDEQLPTARLKTHAFAADGTEIVSYKDRYWMRKDGSKEWQTGILKQYFADASGEVETLPVTHWDVHTFAPSGKEIIIVGEDLWFKEPKATAWTKKRIEDYFGEDFPLEQEIAEKEKVEEETDVKKYQMIKDKVMNELLKFFRPELVNRFDEVIVFEPLKFKHMLLIVELQIKALSKLLEEQEIGFAVTEAAKKAIVREGFDPIFGARPLRRAIQKLIENPISEMIIAQRVKAGDTLVVDYDGEEFIFNVERGAHVSSDTQADAGVQSNVLRHARFTCLVDNRTFETDVVARATTICPTCASPKVKEFQADPAKPEEQKKEVPPQEQLPAQGAPAIPQPIPSPSQPVSPAQIDANTVGEPSMERPEKTQPQVTSGGQTVVPDDIKGQLRQNDMSQVPMGAAA